MARQLILLIPHVILRGIVVHCQGTLAGPGARPCFHGEPPGPTRGTQTRAAHDLHEAMLVYGTPHGLAALHRIDGCSCRPAANEALARMVSGALPGKLL